MEELLNKVTCGNCLDVMKKLPNNSVDLVVTDPPYGLNFMNLDFDKAVPSVEIWKECIRVLKDGAFAFVMSSPRLDVLTQMGIRLQQAGFRIDFTPIYHTYASGFPKAGNISKLVDKRLGAEREVIGKRIHPTLVNIPNVKSNAYHVETLNSDKNMESWDITAPASPEAKVLDGSYGGFQPKPAVEVIIVAMKPLSESTYVDQALKNKHGITWLDNCRIPYQSKDDKEKAKIGFKDSGLSPENGWNNHHMIRSPEMFDQRKGRFPANLLVSSFIDINISALLEAKRILNEKT